MYRPIDPIPNNNISIKGMNISRKRINLFSNTHCISSIALNQTLIKALKYLLQVFFILLDVHTLEDLTRNHQKRPFDITEDTSVK